MTEVISKKIIKIKKKNNVFFIKINEYSNINRFQNIMRSEKILRRIDDVYLIDSLGNILLSDVRDITEEFDFILFNVIFSVFLHVLFFFESFLF